jgi:hypothetical protein
MLSGPAADPTAEIAEHLVLEVQRALAIWHERELELEQLTAMFIEGLSNRQRLRWRLVYDAQLEAQAAFEDLLLAALRRHMPLGWSAVMLLVWEHITATPPDTLTDCCHEIVGDYTSTI